MSPTELILYLCFLQFLHVVEIHWIYSIPHLVACGRENLCFFANNVHWKVVVWWNHTLLHVQHAEMVLIWQFNFSGKKKGSILEVDWIQMTGFDIFSLK